MQPFAKLNIAELEHIRVLATDIDDTITTAGKIPSSTIEGLVALEKAGIVVALVTGRPAGWAQALASYLAGVRVAVAENGLVSFDSNGLRKDLGPPRGPNFSHD
jgi:hydroxymethylpyrimidine pyrophosphatase-like HAD family hydrolase